MTVFSDFAVELQLNVSAKTSPIVIAKCFQAVNMKLLSRLAKEPHRVVIKNLSLLLFGEVRPLDCVITGVLSSLAMGYIGRTENLVLAHESHFLNKQRIVCFSRNENPARLQVILNVIPW